MKHADFEICQTFNTYLEKQKWRRQKIGAGIDIQPRLKSNIPMKNRCEYIPDLLFQTDKFIKWYFK